MMITFKQNTGIKPYLTKIPLSPLRPSRSSDRGDFSWGGGGGRGLFKRYFRGSVFLYAAV